MKSVLVIEDNPLVRELIVSCLARIQANIRAVNSAEEALDTIRHDGRPDLILSDVVLPQRSGSDLVKHLRGNEMTRDIPVVAVTVLADPKDELRLRADGFSDVIAKPIDPALFTARVARWIK